jgi:Arc/MetJ-type ribon-helix-helix transcriptional regulator
MEGGMVNDMAIQIAVRLSDEQLAAVDAAVRAGRYPSRAAAVRAGVDRLLKEEREQEIADAYRRGYGKYPQEEWIGKAGLAAMAKVIEQEERVENG